MSDWYPLASTPTLVKNHYKVTNCKLIVILDQCGHFTLSIQPTGKILININRDMSIQNG